MIRQAEPALKPRERISSQGRGSADSSTKRERGKTRPELARRAGTEPSLARRAGVARGNYSSGIVQLMDR
jgi:hypothetical protein